VPEKDHIQSERDVQPWWLIAIRELNCTKKKQTC